MRAAPALFLALLASSRSELPAAVEPPRPVPPAASMPWETAPVPARRVTYHRLDSRAAGARVSYHLYRPAAYERETERRFPAVYWLHGSGGGGAGIAPLAALFDAAIEAGQLPPCLVIFVNGLPGGMYVDWKDGSVRVESVIIRDLIPHVDATWRTVSGRNGRVIEGFSMGGYGAARLGFKHPHLFAGISLLGAGPLQADFSQAPRAGPKERDRIFRQVYGGDAGFFLEVSPWSLAERNREQLQGALIRQVVGAQDETFANNRAFHERMEALRVPHEWSVLPGIGHDPLRLIRALGAGFWAFHRKAFSAGEAVRPAGAGGATGERPPVGPAGPPR